MDGDNANANETKGAQEGIVTDASVSSTNANADVKSAIKSDEIPPLIEKSSSSESGREETERVPLPKFCYTGGPDSRHLDSGFQRLTSEANGIKNVQLKAYYLTNMGEELPFSDAPGVTKES